MTVRTLTIKSTSLVPILSGKLLRCGAHTYITKRARPSLQTGLLAPAAVRHILITKVRESGGQLRSLRDILSLQDVWGVECCRRLRAVVPFPIDRKRTSLKQLRKLAGLQQSLNNVVRLFPCFIEKPMTRHDHNISN